jgi:3-deoxy-manno-octulosonate cytidylyltransferase (CMP-KDO synthetase)
VPLLERLLALPPSPLERIESLEQLRALEAGIPMRVVQVGPQGPSVDTAEDLRRVESILHAAGDATARPARGRGAQS